MVDLYPGFQKFDIAVEGNIVIHVARSGTGPPLLLLHGFPQTHMIWHKVARNLVARYTLVIMDIRGYGGSSKPAVSYQSNPQDHRLYAKSAMARDCAMLMTKLNFESFFVCGHDRGGRVAHKLCVDYPTRVTKCMVLDICPTKAMYEATDMRFAHGYWHWFFLTQPAPFPEKIMLASPNETSQKFLKGGGTDIFFEDALAEYKKQFQDWDTVHAMCEDYRASMQEDIAESYKDIQEGRKIRCPLMVLWGKRGIIEALFDARTLWAEVCETGVLDESSGPVDCGHYIPEEAPEDLTKYIEAFFLL